MSPLPLRVPRLLLLALTLSACHPAPVPRQPPPLVLLVTDGGRVDDAGLNEAVLDGLLEAQTLAGFRLDFLEPEGPGLQVAEGAVARRPHLLVLVGRQAVPWAVALAPSHPTMAFLVVDGLPGGEQPNLAGVHWPEEEGVRLGGRALGELGRGPLAAVLQAPPQAAVRWERAFREGVLSACPDCPSVVLPLPPEAGPAEGRRAADELIRRGVRGAFGAGGRGAEEALLTLAAEGIPVAGGWTDAYLTLFRAGAERGGHRVLGSVVKDAAPAVRTAVLDWSRGSLHSVQGAFRLVPPGD